MDLSAMKFCEPATSCITCAGPIRLWDSKRAYGHTFRYSQCQVCELVFVNPRPTLQSLGAFYAQYSQAVTEYWAKKRVEPLKLECRVNADAFSVIDRMLALRPAPGRFLDVGAGEGWGAAAAARRGLSVTALEVDDVCAAMIEAQPGVQCQRVLFEDFDASPQTFDYILMSHVLEHAHDPKLFVARAHRLLSPGGVLWISLPNLDGIYRRLWGMGDPWFSPPAHLNHFNRRSLSMLCRSVGFRVARIEDRFGLPKDVFSRRLPKSHWAATMIEAGTIAAARAANIALGIARAGSVLSIGAVKPARSSGPIAAVSADSRNAAH